MKLIIINLACVCNGLIISQFKNEKLPTIRRVAYDDKIYNKAINSGKSENDAIKKISSPEKKLINCIGSLYNVGNILNKN